MRSVLLTLTLSMSSFSLLAQPLTLQELIDQQQSDPLFRAGQADLRVLDAEAKLHQDRAGWQVFAGAGVGHYDELVASDVRDDYNGRNLSLGVRHPLLGSLKRQLDLLQTNQYERQRQQSQNALEIASQRLALRSAYADWWRVQQESAFCAAFVLAARKAGQAIRLRMAKGASRTSEGHLQLDEWEGISSRCMALPKVEGDVREDLASISMSGLPATAQAVAEPLAPQPQPLVQWQALLNQHPRVTEKQSLRDLADKERDNSWYSSIDSDIALASTREYRSDSDKAGSGMVASLNLSTPFDLVGNTRARQRVADARYEAASSRVEAERRSLGLELSKALRAHNNAQALIMQRSQQWHTAALALNEEKARSKLDANGNFNALLTTERVYFQSGFELIAAWHAAWLRQAELNLFTEDSPQFAALLGDERLEWSPMIKPQPSAMAATSTSAVRRQQIPVEPKKWLQATYVWNSEALLDPMRRQTELQALRKAGMQKIYLGLNALQVSNLSVTRQQLEQLLQEAARSGLQVSLLLGDPTWIEPQHRKQLTDLLEKFNGLSFASLHLDLEVEQLGMPVPDQRLKDWLDTLRAASVASRWPVEISSHHRWFVAAQAGHPCVPCALPAIGVRQVSLMIYTHNPQRSAQLAGEIAQRWPDLQFRLAQSTEPQLPSTESWADASAEQLQRQVAVWRKQLQPQGIAGIDWQAWRDFPKR
ncbi:TolC family protein [Pseudomonas sp. P8_241]|uniref:TolC family protein n=1 Tax=Pseudomonas sp. P8_241 TaxID=3043445 RepID=UPI002A36B77D|nr:TolC family protein [Pseudomonas sp. P8_241]WPN49126.1 TolC family protein [Pseudomonas sp. P8_241]